MNEIEKLFRKINKKENLALREVVDSLLQKKHQSLDIKKLQQSDFYRLRKGNFRIIFHCETNGEVVIDSVRLKGEDTYKNFI